MVNYSIGEKIEEKKWANFLNLHSYANIFQSPQMYQVYQKTKNYEPLVFGAIDDNNYLVGILLAVIQKEHQGILGKFSSRSIIMGGPIVKDNDPEILDFLLKNYNKKIKGKAIYTQVRNLYDQSWAKATFLKHGFVYEAHLDILHDLTKPVEEQFAVLHKGRRKNIRRAERAEVVFRPISNKQEFDRALKLVDETYKRVKLPMPDKSLFTESYYQLSKQNILKTFVAVSNEEIIGCRMVLCYGDIIYDWYAGASDKHLDKYPNDFLPWKVIEWGHNNGYKTFDFGGAGKPNIPYGVRDHKLKFGGELVEFGRFEKVHNKVLMKIGELGLKLYKWIK